MFSEERILFRSIGCRDATPDGKMPGREAETNSQDKPAPKQDSPLNCDRFHSIVRHCSLLGKASGETYLIGSSVARSSCGVIASPMARTTGSGTISWSLTDSDFTKFRSDPIPAELVPDAFLERRVQLSSHPLQPPCCLDSIAGFDPPQPGARECSRDPFSATNQRFLRRMR